MISEPVLIDTGAFAAMFDPRDRYHEICVQQFCELPLGKAFTCWPVVTEAMYLIRRYPQKQRNLLQGIAAGDFPLLELAEPDAVGIAAVISKYGDLEVDLADAALVHLANREGVAAVFPFDRRQFATYRRSDGQSLRLLPDVI